MSLSVAQLQLLEAINEDPWVAVVHLDGGQDFDAVALSLRTRRLIDTPNDGDWYRLTSYGVATLALFRGGRPYAA
jgi:hypothetical protein